MLPVSLKAPGKAFRVRLKHCAVEGQLYCTGKFGA